MRKLRSDPNGWPRRIGPRARLQKRASHEAHLVDQENVDRRRSETITLASFELRRKLSGTKMLLFLYSLSSTNHLLAAQCGQYRSLTTESPRSSLPPAQHAPAQRQLDQGPLQRADLLGARRCREEDERRMLSRQQQDQLGRTTLLSSFIPGGGH